MSAQMVHPFGPLRTMQASSRERGARTWQQLSCEEHRIAQSVAPELTLSFSSVKCRLSDILHVFGRGP
jgi:hypothetical protein